MFLNRYKTLVLALLVLGFFCFLGGISSVGATAELTPDECFMQSGEDSCYDVTDNSFAEGTGPADLAITGTVKVGNQTTEWGSIITLTPADSFLVINNSAAFNIQYSEKNNGGAEALSYRNEITFSGNMVSQQTNRSLASLASTEVWTQAYFPIGDGSYEFVLTLDADGQMREDNEDDNFGRLTIKFSGFGEEETEMLPATNEANEGSGSVRGTVPVITPVSEPVANTGAGNAGMSCGNSSGGDGVYSLCKGDTLYHDLGIKLYNRAYNGDELKLTATGLTDTYVRLKLNTPVTVYDTDREHILSLKYTGKDSVYGAFLQISQEGKVEATDETGSTSPTGSAGSGDAVLPATNDSVTGTTGEGARSCEVIKTGGKRVIAFGDNKVYYVYGNYKYWFPNEEIYLSWFDNFNGIDIISQAELNGYTTGASVCKKTSGTTGGSGMLPAYNEAIRRTPNTNASEATGMSCGNSEGGDGLYSACKGDTIYHSSGIKILNRAYSGDVVKFMLSGADQTYIRVDVGKSVEVKSADGTLNLRLTYQEKSAQYGAFVLVATSLNEAVEATSDSSSIPAGEVDTDGFAGEPKSSSEPEAVETVSGVGIDFKVYVNNYPEHQNYALNQNLAGAYVNMYYVDLQSDGMFKVGEADIKGTVVPADGSDAVAVFSVAPGKMVYFEGFKSYDNALQGVNDKMAINWSAPPYKNFSSGNRIKNRLCQTNFSNVNMYLSCSDNLSTPYID
ncbi:MAG: CARDB domain-containing protein [Candidatus Magasanikbacteria bacterium]